MRVISVREEPLYKEQAIHFFQEKWASPETGVLYRDCIENSLTTSSPLPQWYLLENNNEIVGGCGLITNDFISRMDLFPWLCALYVNESYRGKNLAKLLIERCIVDTKQLNFSHIYLCSDLEHFYEKFGFNYIATGYQITGESIKIYSLKL